MSKSNFYLLKAVNTVNVVIIVGAGFMLPLWSDFVRHIGGDIRTAGQAVFLFSIVIGVVTCFAGPFENRFNRDEDFMFWSQLVMCLGYAGYFFVAHPWQLYIVQVVLGAGGAFQSPAVCALYQRFMPEGKASHYWGIWNGFYQIAMGIGALAGAYLVHHYDFRLFFSGLLGVSLLGLLWSFIVMVQIRQVSPSAA